MGCSLDTLRSTLTEYELREWMLYRRQRAMPLERIEILLAQIAYWIAIVNGQDKSFDDFMLPRDFIKEEDDKPEPFDMDEARAFFGFPPERLKDGTHG